MKRAFLTEELGLDRETVNAIMKEHGLAIQAEMDKHNDEMETLKAEMAKLSTDTTNINELKASLEQAKELAKQFEDKFNETNQALESERKNITIEKALTALGGNDLEYLKYKLGDVEDLDTLDEKVNALKEQLPTFFGETASAQADEPKADVEVTGNPLQNGEKHKTFSLEEINQLSTDEINANWSLIAESLKNQ